MHARASSSARVVCDSRSPKRTFSIESSCSASASSCESGIASRGPSVRLRAQEVAEPHAELARLLGPGRDQRVDRVEAVEQEVRVDLRAQRAQLRLARGDLGLQRAPLGALRGPHRHQQVGERGVEQEQAEAEAEQQRRRLQLLRDEAGEDVEPLEQHREAARGGEPQRGRERRGHELGSERAEDPRQVQRRGLAHPERREPEEAQEQRERHAEREGFEPREGPGERELYREERADAAPRPRGTSRGGPNPAGSGAWVSS